MDGERFDTIAKGLATGSSRRRVIGGVLGSAAALLAGGTTLAAKRKRGTKAKGRKAKVRAQGGSEGTGQDKRSVCHWDEDAQAYTLITVGSPGAEAHLRQHEEDFEFFPGDSECCNASECEANAGPCREVSSCNEGNCVYTNINQGEPCPVGDDDGMCINGECRLLSTGNTCNNADPCAEGVVCGTTGSEDCVCYSSTEQGNICIRRSEATCDRDRRPTGCNNSDDCLNEDDPSFCAPLDRAGGICCPREDLAGFRGFCVPVSAACTAAV